MGNAWYCKKCEQGRKMSVSNACPEKLIDEETKHEYTSEERWMNRLHCIDELHTKTHGLTLENFNKWLETVEKHALVHKKKYCENRAELIACLQRNPNCMIECMKEMDDFIDCVDAARINKIKEKMKLARKETKDNETAKLFNT